MPRQRLTNQ